MSWRVVVISNRCKLDYSMNYMVIRGEDTKRLLLDEIALLILENNAISMTGCLLSALIDKKIRIVLCDGQHNPQAEINPYYGAHNDVLKIKQQIGWTEVIKKQVWTCIVREKISNQSKLLEIKGKQKEATMLKGYVKELKDGDISNREGHAAKVYFNGIFGMEFTRRDEENVINAALNYGYSIILSAFNREVISNGFITQLGLAHIPFELNEKRLITKLQAMLEKETVNTENFEKTMGLLADIERYIYGLSEVLPYELDFSGINISALIKMCGLTIVDDSISVIERIYNYMNIVRDLLGERLFIFANIRSYFNDNDLQSFIDTVLSHKFNVILIDHSDGKKLNGMRKIIVDNDLCVI